jgi:hypothetical protein
MVRRKYRSAVVVTLVLALLLLLPAQAGAWVVGRWTYDYDGCNWTLTAEYSLAIEWAKVTENNTGCRYLTAYFRHANGTYYAQCGPVTTSSVTCRNPGPGTQTFQVRGRITTWEHGWYQDSGWKGVSV